MPFYRVEQKGVPGVRLIEAEKPAGAINHVISDTFSAKKVDGRELLDLAKTVEAEIAGAPPAPATPAPASDDDESDEGAGNADEELDSDRLREDRDERERLADEDNPSVND